MCHAILEQYVRDEADAASYPVLTLTHFTHFPGTKVQKLTVRDEADAASYQVLTLLALLVQKYKKTDAKDASSSLAPAPSKSSAPRDASRSVVN